MRSFEARCSKGPLVILKQLKQTGNVSIKHMPSLKTAADLYITTETFQSFK